MTSSPSCVSVMHTQELRCLNRGRPRPRDRARRVDRSAEPGGQYLALGKRLLSFTGYAKPDVQVWGAPCPRIGLPSLHRRQRRGGQAHFLAPTPCPSAPAPR
jgi:hypothetical protein